jgi:hypothetical protein
MALNEKREDDLASIFVDKVITKRQQDFDTAWDRFSSRVSQGNSPLQCPYC